MYIAIINLHQAANFTAKKTTNCRKWYVTRNALHQRVVNK